MLKANQNEKSPKVKIVAIAKDEAAYLSDWVHHHLYLGFDALDIYINRTSDNSVEVLKSISERYSNVKAKSADWVDLCPDDAQFNLQYIIYAHAFAEAKDSKEFDYILFLDIDEFWTPKSMRWTVQEVIEASPNAHTISFQWINEFGQDERFQGLRQSIDGRINPLVKTLIRLDAPVTKVRYHFPEMDNAKSVMVDGDLFRSDTRFKEGLHIDLQHLRPVMVIHRLFRSPLEYISLLYRGRPSDDIQIKLNRGGYNQATGREVLFELNKDGYAKYLQSQKDFIASMPSELLHDARAFVEQRYHKTLACLPDIPRMYFVDLFRIFKGCTEAEYKILTDSIKGSRRLKRCKDPDELIELAKEIERFDTDVAHEIWKLALSLRPKGPMIKARIRDYLADTNHDQRV